MYITTLILRMHILQMCTLHVMVIIVRDYGARKRRGMGEGMEEHGTISGDEEGNTDYGGMVQPSQQHVAPCVKVVE